MPSCFRRRILRWRNVLAAPVAGPREMLEGIGALSSRPISIRLDTRAGNSIENEQSLPTDTSAESRFSAILRKHSSWQVRRACSGVYNCFGHVWASRRTSIYESDEVWKILADDQYRQIQPTDVVQGDVALYLHEGTEEIWHAAIVIEIKPIYNTAGKVPWVLSKWGDAMAEVFHPLEDVHAPVRTASKCGPTDRDGATS